MLSKKNFKLIPFILIIFLLPFLDFVKNNISEIDIILGKSFIFLIFVLFFILLIIAYIIKLFFKKIDFTVSFFIVVFSYWLFFKHNSLNLLLFSFLKKFASIGSEFSSEISLLILIILSIYFSILIYKNNKFFKKFILIFFSLTFFVSLFQIIKFNYESNISDLTSNISNLSKEDSINFPDKIKNKKENIYFFILDAMQPINEFEKYYKLNKKDFINYVENRNYTYMHNTVNTYDNTTHSLSAFFYLDKIFNEDKKLNNKMKILYPTLLREKNSSTLINNLNELGYDFKWLGNFFAYCPKFNLRYCLSKNSGSIIDSYLYINFFRQSPLIQIIINFGYIFNFDFEKNFYYKLNDGMGRLINHLSEDHKINDKPTFYFIHHMSPHWPYLTDEDCSYKKYPGNRNIDGYKSAYLCTLKKIQITIEFLNEFDPNSTVVFQSDHNWIMSKDMDEKKRIFNLIKINKNCNLDKDINLNNVNALRLIFSCMTGNKVKYISD